MSESENARWAATLALLDVATTRRALGEVIHFPTPRQETADHDHTASTVRLIDRLDCETVLLSWSDPLMGHRCEETWKLAVARRSGWCALTYLRIKRGDPVYHPARSSSRNLNEMVIAACVDATPIGESLVSSTYRFTESSFPVL